MIDAHLRSQSGLPRFHGECAHPWPVEQVKRPGTARWKQTIARVGYDRQAPCGHVVGTLVPVAPSVLT